MNKSFVPVSVPWDFKRQPDLIVINLGTNDDTYTQNFADRQEEFCVHYQKFLKKIRSFNPHAKILCTLGLVTDGLFPYVEKAVAEYSLETGDTNVFTLKSEKQLPEEGYAAEYHPSVVTQDKIAKQLTEEIKRLFRGIS